MTPAQQVSLLIPAAYVIGSVPFGLMVGRLKGIDPRTAGSGNIGASNVGRLLGRKFFVMVFLLDLLKGLLPMLLAGHVLQGAAPAARTYFVWLLVGFAAIFGHMFSVFLGFKGGKGVATSSGVILGLFPYFTIPGVIALAVWAVVLRGTGYISVASIVAAVLFPVSYVLLSLVNRWPLLREQLPLLVFSVLVAAMIVYKHRSNLARLRAGTEPRYDAPRAGAGGETGARGVDDAPPRPASAA